MEFLFFALGTIVASLVGVISARLNTGSGFVTGRSRCDACNEPLPPHTLFPVISYLVSGGKSHCCGARIALYSPLTELLLGGLYVLAYLKLGLVGALPLLLFALALLLALVLYDLMHQILPTGLLYSFVAVVFLFRAVSSADLREFSTALLAALLIATSLAAIHVFSRGRAMGFADAPLSFGLALLVGARYAFTGFVFSFWIGAVVGITLLARRPRGSRMGVEVPFAPYLAAGFLLAYFIIQWNPFDLILGY